MHRQKTYSNKCELSIEKFQLPDIGQVYFRWRKGQKSQQSFIHNTGGTYQIHEKLRLDLKLYLQNEKFQPKFTHFELLNSYKTVIWSTQLGIHEWDEFPKKISLPVTNERIKSGLIVVKVSRKFIMELQNFSRNTGEIEESQDEEKVKQRTSKRIGQDRQQIINLEKELQDANELIEKLKKDRTTFLFQKEKLQNENRVLKERIKGEITRIEEHYKKKFQIIQSIYEAEIHQLIETYNENFETNRQIASTMVIEIEELNLTILEQRQEFDNILKAKEEDFAEKVMILEGQNEELMDKNTQLQDKIRQYERRLEESQERQDALKTDLQNQILNSNIEKEELNKRIKGDEEKISNLEEEIYKLKVQIDGNNVKIDLLEKQVENFKEKQKQLEQRYNETEEERLRLDDENLTKLAQIEDKDNVIKHYELRIQGLENDLVQKDKMIDEIEKQREDLRKQNDDERQAEFLEREEMRKQLDQELMQMRREKQDVQTKVYEMDNELKRRESELDELKHHEEILMQELAEKDHNIDNLKREEDNLHADREKALNQNIQLENNIHTLTAKLTDGETDLQRLTIEYEELRKQLQEKEKHIQFIQTSSKNQYDDLVRNNILQREQEQSLRKKMEDQWTKEFERLQGQIQFYRSEVDKVALQLEDERNNMDNERKNNQLHFQTMFQDNKQYKEQVIKLEELLEKNRMEYEEALRNSLLIDERRKDLTIPGLHPKDLTYNKISLNYSQDELNIPKIAQLQTELERKIQENYDLNQKKSQLEERCKETESDLMNKMHTIKRYEAEIDELDRKINYFQHKYWEEEERAHELSMKLFENGLILENQLKNREEVTKQKEQQIKKRNQLKSEEEIGSPRSKTRSEKRFEIKEFANQEIQVNIETEEEQQQLEEKPEKHQENQKKKQQILLELEKDTVTDLEKKQKTQKSERSIKSERSQQEKKKKIVQKKSERQEKSQKKLKRKQTERDNTQQMLELKKEVAVSKNRVSERDEIIKKLQKRNTELFEDIVALKQEMAIKLSISQSKMLEYEKRYEAQELKKSVVIDQQTEDLKKSKDLLTGKIQDLKMRNQQLTLQNKRMVFEGDQYLNQIKKLKKDLEEYEAKEKRTSGFDFVKTLQSDLQQANKNIIQLSKNIHLLKMEKENGEQEINLLKKKLIQHEKRVMVSDEKANSMEIELQDEKRKVRKMKRDIEDKDEELSKYKDGYKKIQDEMSTYGNFNTQNMYEKKKAMEEKLEMQDKISKKQTQILKLQKQIEKYKNHIQENEDYKNNRHNEMRRQIEKLEKTIVQYSRTIAEYEQKTRILNRRVETAERQKKNSLDEEKRVYGDKLKFYLEEFAHMKQLYDENQYDMDGLRVENNQIIIENQNLKANLDELQEKFNELIDYKNNLQGEIVKKKELIEQLTADKSHVQLDSTNLHNVVANLKADLQKQRLMSQRKTEKVEQSEEASEKFIYEIKNLKIRLKEFEATRDITDELRAQNKSLEKQNTQLIDQLQSMMNQYEKYRNTYSYSQSQLEKVLQELKENLEDVKREQLENQSADLQKQYHNKNIKLETQVLELYNENAKLGVEIQRKGDELIEIMSKYQQIEKYPEKYRQAIDKIQFLENQITLYKAQDVQLTNKAQRAEVALKESERVVQTLRHEIQLLKSSCHSEKQKAKKLLHQLSEAQTGQSLAKDELKNLRLTKNETNDQLAIRIQNYESKLLAAELQNERLKERDQTMYRDYNQKVGKLEAKIKEMQENSKRNYNDLQKQTHKDQTIKSEQVKHLKRQIEKLSSTNENLKQKFQTLKQQNGELTLDLTSTRNQMAEDEEIYVLQINQLKNKIKDMEELYHLNLSNLEEELSHLNKELTMQRLKRKTQSLGNSRLRESEVDRRYEEKCKQKDVKIQELKNELLIMQETLIKMKKKESPDDRSASSKYKGLYEDLLRQTQMNKEEEIKEKERLEEIIKGLKKELLRIKQSEQSLSLKNDHQSLELQSVKCELKTVGELYSTLQKEVDKRKMKVGQEMQMQNHYQKQIEYKSLKIAELEEKYNQCMAKLQSTSSKLLKKEHELSILGQKNEQLFHQINKGNQTQSSLTNTVQLKDRQKEELLAKLQNLEKENKRLVNQINLLNNKLIQVRNKHGILEKECSSLKLQKEQLKSEVMENMVNSSKLIQLNKKCFQSYGISLEEMLTTGFWEEKLFDKDQEINQLAEQLEEIKFLQERKFLDYDELKKINFQLEMKIDDYDILNEQLEILRRECDKLEEEKKISVLREETLRMQIQNLIPSASSEMKNKIETILLENYDLYE